MAMASLLSLLCSCMILFLVASATQFKVGDDQLGWHEPSPNNTAFYTQWAARNRFQVDDSLLFEYQNDSVLIVEKWDYFHCDPRDPITSFDNGNNTINLDRPGAFYFISGTDDHCQKGQKLIVEVMSPHPIHTSPPPEDSSPAMPPSTSQSYSSASMVIASVFMPLLATFVIVLLLAP
ncbi:Phytocyanin domain [Sesbania bispinosa]|nr:Phytocyanin domain [Sesbania bispinosa]